MYKVFVNQWGNSVGIRIPSAVIKENEIEVGEEFSLSTTENGGILLTPLNIPQLGWKEAFNAIAEKQDAKNNGKIKEEIVPFIPNQFDDESWTW